jgi:hypothetical protein
VGGDYGLDEVTETLSVGRSIGRVDVAYLVVILDVVIKVPVRDSYFEV